MTTNLLIGKTITAVYLADDKQAIKFEFGDGVVESIVAQCDGDCCSHTWIEAVDNPEFLIGTPILAVRDLEYRSENYGENMFYGLAIDTIKGTCKLDYRNNSNGYYGGSLNWPDDGYYYGGVYGQNKSKQVWSKIA